MTVAWTVPLLLLVLQTASAAVDAEEKICDSVVVRNTPDRLLALENCTVVNGYVHIVLLDETKDEDFRLSFPKLREITQYLVVYRVTGLTSLGSLFPNLALIRGVRSADFPGLALMIHDNKHLVEIGLRSLTNITQGSVIITNNPKLCYTTTIDWGQITNGVNNSTNIITNNENQKCGEGCANMGCPDNRCWSSNDCQYGTLTNCHPLCAGRCFQPHSAKHCLACTGFMYNGECVKECPPGMYGHIRDCLTADQCRNISVIKVESKRDENTNYIPFEHLCRDECPYLFQLTEDKQNCTPCTKTKYGNCKRHCDGFIISDDVLNKNLVHMNCTTITSLEIELKFGTREDIERQLEEYLGKVEVIVGQLKITRSYSLTSLNFLRNLDEIRGENFGNNKIALLVRENKNLQKLWTTKDNETRPVKILNGTVSFHYNPKLCMSEIYKFGNLSTLPVFTDLEVSYISNGDQFACTVYNLQVDTIKIESQSMVLSMQKPDEIDNLERFLVYFIEADKWNETIETTECDASSWRIDDISSRRTLNETQTVIQHSITNLEPNTEYVYYVKTYTVSSKTSMSSIFRNKTLPSKPSAPQNFAAVPVSSSEVKLAWQPPSHPHGKLVKYIVKGLHLSDDQTVLDQRSYCKNKTVEHNEVYRSASLMKPSPIDQACSKQCEPQKNSFDMCNNFEHNIDVNFIPDNNQKNMFEMCSNYLYTFINEKCRFLQNYDDNVLQDNRVINENCTEKWTISDKLNDTYGGDGGLVPLYYELNDNITSFNLGPLKHYSLYVLSLSVCREVVDQERGLNKSDACSYETLITFRTSKSDEGDIINEERVRASLNNHTVNISWEVPTLVNSMILSFQLEYKLKESHSFTAVCITMKDYETAGQSYMIENLSSGEYQYRIRVTSLAGNGKFTKSLYFTVPDSIENLQWIFMTIVVGCTLIFFTGIIIHTYFSRKLSERNNIYNLANNPTYHGIYVEDEWELQREDIIIQKILGRGSFGTVHEGILMPQNILCAVKSVSKTNFLRYHTEFLNEAAIMKKFSEAYHIVKLLGVVTKSHPPLLVMELMGKGDLKSVLIKSREDPTQNPPNRYTIIRMAAQIADGMAFLEYNKFVHRDLAARNCMVANDMTVKIGDFGMSRKIYNGDYYRKGNKGHMPVRWMAPESLSEGIFTSQTDIWGYGVVIWEMMTLGEQPYSDKGNDGVMTYVLDGNTLVLPIFCPGFLAAIAKLCWSWSPSQRPGFLKIVKTLDDFLDDNFRSVSFYHTRGEDNDSPGEYSLMSPCTTLEDEVENESISFEGGDTVAVYNAFHVEPNKISNGHLSSTQLF